MSNGTELPTLGIGIAQLEPQAYLESRLLSDVNLEKTGHRKIIDVSEFRQMRTQKSINDDVPAVPTTGARKARSHNSRKS